MDLYETKRIEQIEDRIEDLLEYIQKVERQQAQIVQALRAQASEWLQPGVAAEKALFILDGLE